MRLYTHDPIIPVDYVPCFWLRRMNSAEARSVASQFLARYRTMPYRELCQLIELPTTDEFVAYSGVRFQVEVQAFWDDPAKPNDVIRVVAAVDDGGARAFFPLCEAFLMRPDGSILHASAA